MFEGKPENQPPLDLNPARQEDWDEIVAAAELLAVLAVPYEMRERTITAPNARIEVCEEVNYGRWWLSAYKQAETDPVVHFVFNETGEPEEVPDVAPADRLGLAEDIWYVFSDVANALDRTGSLRDQPLLMHLENYAAYLRDDCSMGGIETWLEANGGFFGRIMDATRTGSVFSYRQLEYCAETTGEELLQVVQIKFNDHDRKRLQDKPYIEVKRTDASGNDYMTIQVLQSGEILIRPNFDVCDPYGLTSSGGLTKYGAQAIIDRMFDVMSVDLSRPIDENI